MREFFNYFCHDYFKLEHLRVGETKESINIEHIIFYVWDSRRCELAWVLVEGF